jgi:hypothetical protein
MCTCIGSGASGSDAAAASCRPSKRMPVHFWLKMFEGQITDAELYPIVPPRGAAAASRVTQSTISQIAAANNKVALGWTSLSDIESERKHGVDDEMSHVDTAATVAAAEPTAEELACFSAASEQPYEDEDPDARTEQDASDTELHDDEQTDAPASYAASTSKSKGEPTRIHLHKWFLANLDGTDRTWPAATLVDLQPVPRG